MRRLKRNSFLYNTKLSFALIATVIVALLSQPADAAGNIPFQGGPVMNRPIKVFLIFWRGPCWKSNPQCTQKYLPTAKNGIGNYETVITNFFNGIGGTGYFNILSQYFGACGSDGNSTCVPPNAAGIVLVPKNGVFNDTSSPYQHAGTTSDPLDEGDDIQSEIQRAVAANPTWSVGLGSEFFVFTPVGMQECNNNGNCTFPNGNVVNCAYHDDFSLNNNDAVYAAMPSQQAGPNLCFTSPGTPNGQVLTDSEIVVMSHEFFESASDPQPDSNTAWSGNGSEIGEGTGCTGATGTLRSDGSNVTLSGSNFIVQKIWSNDSLQSGCILSFGPTALINTVTGSDDLNDDSDLNFILTQGASTRAMNANLAHDTWNDNSTQMRVLAVPKTTLNTVTTKLTSHPNWPEGLDAWNLQRFTVTLQTPAGQQICQQTASGNPLERVTDAQPFFIDTPNCAPPSATFPPQGEYRTTCTDWKMDGTTLSAQCQDYFGSWITTHLDNATDCHTKFGIVNVNGNLRCVINQDPIPNLSSTGPVPYPHFNVISKLKDTTQHDSETIVWRIDQPNVIAASTRIPTIAFSPNDTVRFDAGGCVQIGGGGSSWKRYVNPYNPDGVNEYFGEVAVEHAPVGQTWQLGHLVALREYTQFPSSRTWNVGDSPGALIVGYQDEAGDYGDNGYYGHDGDSGNNNQCAEGFATNNEPGAPAWIEITINRAQVRLIDK